MVSDVSHEPRARCAVAAHPCDGPAPISRDAVPGSSILTGAREYLGAVAQRTGDQHPGLTVRWSIAANVDSAANLIHLADHLVTGTGTAGGSMAPTRA